MRIKEALDLRQFQELDNEDKTQGKSIYSQLKPAITALELRVLLSYVTGFSQEYLIGHNDERLSNEDIVRFLALVKRRQIGEPIAYIIGKKEFYGREFCVTPDVLIPRPDSETLIEAVLVNVPIIHKESGAEEQFQILELGIGSGCLLLTLLLEIPNSLGVGVDISNQALEIARQNAIALEIYYKVKFATSNWFENVIGKYDVIISNPPYIHEYEKDVMAYETLKYEPSLALFGGLEPYYVIAANAHKFLKKHGRICVEIGVNQEKKVEEIFKAAGYIVTGKHHDIEERVRVIAFTLDTG